MHEIPREQAARIGHALLPGLPRLDEDWREPLRLACLVLDEMAQEPLSDSSQGHFGWQGAGVASFIFDVNTSTYWEQIVRDAWPLKKAKKGWPVHAWLNEKCEPLRPPSTRNGRTRRSGMQADIVAGLVKSNDLSMDRVVADVKYTNYDAASAAAVQRQIFAYSHLYKAWRTFVVYLAESCRKQDATFYRQTSSQGSSRKSCKTDVTCEFIGLPFPSADDVQDGAWKVYMTGLEKCLKTMT